VPFGIGDAASGGGAGIVGDRGAHGTRRDRASAAPGPPRDVGRFFRARLPASARRGAGVAQQALEEAAKDAAATDRARDVEDEGFVLVLFAVVQFPQQLLSRKWLSIFDSHFL